MNKDSLFSCEEAALEGQKEVCVSVCPSSKLNFTLKKQHTKPIDCTSVHKTNWLYKGTQNQFTVQVYTKLVYTLPTEPVCTP